MGDMTAATAAYYEAWCLVKSKSLPPEGVWCLGGRSEKREDLARWENDPDTEIRKIEPGAVTYEEIG